MRFTLTHAERSAHIADLLVACRLSDYLSTRRRPQLAECRCCSECRAAFTPNRPKALTCSERCAETRKKRKARTREERRTLKRRAAV